MRVVYILLFSLSLAFYNHWPTYIEDKFTRIRSSKNIYSYGPQPSEAINASTIRFAFVLGVPFKYMARKSSRRGCSLINASVLDRLVNICIYTLLNVTNDIFQKERFVYGFYDCWVYVLRRGTFKNPGMALFRYTYPGSICNNMQWNRRL